MDLQTAMAGLAVECKVTPHIIDEHDEEQIPQFLDPSEQNSDYGMFAIADYGVGFVALTFAMDCVDYDDDMEHYMAFIVIAGEATKMNTVSYAISAILADHPVTVGMGDDWMDVIDDLDTAKFTYYKGHRWLP